MALLPSEEKKQKQRERLLLEKSTLDKLQEAFKSVIHTEDGRLVMWWLLEEAKVFRSCFTGNSVTFFNEGARELGLKVLEQIMSADDTMFAVMQREAKKRKEEKE